MRKSVQRFSAGIPLSNIGIDDEAPAMRSQGLRIELHVATRIVAPRDRYDQGFRSKRSAFITLAHAAAKSFANFSLESAQA